MTIIQSRLQYRPPSPSSKAASTSVSPLPLDSTPVQINQAAVDWTKKSSISTNLESSASNMNRSTATKKFLEVLCSYSTTIETKNRNTLSMMATYEKRGARRKQRGTSFGQVFVLSVLGSLASSNFILKPIKGTQSYALLEMKRTVKDMKSILTAGKKNWHIFSISEFGIFYDFIKSEAIIKQTIIYLLMSDSQHLFVILVDDPNIEVHGITFGPEFMQVWVDNVISPNTYFFPPSHSKITIQEVVDSFSAWPLEKIWNVWNTLAKVKKKMRSPSSSPILFQSSLHESPLNESRSYAILICTNTSFNNCLTC
ncbi:hypothetical protein F8388_011662 [Cannabis sativa]|uniref:Uncharacterized protein n=1 Tax=Cannabis sativa TaxID=3483 RepID=A0A7J6GX30_CANSA|nr:hypothetical protein F8388_011662 [Cannabis sativa]